MAAITFNDIAGSIIAAFGLFVLGLSIREIILNRKKRNPHE
jgi:hypothetical protein